MNTEERLRDALEAQASVVRPAIDAWDRISRALPEARTRRRPAFTVAFAAVGVLVIVALVAVSLRRGSQQVTTGPPPAGAGKPATQLVALTGQGRIVLLDAETGKWVRTVAYTRADLGSTVAVSPDRRLVFFEASQRGVDYNPCGQGIAAVPLTGGPPVLVAPAASDPALSPDGQRLAYVTGTDELNCSIAVVDLATGARRSFAYPFQPHPPLVPGPGSSETYSCTTPVPAADARPLLVPDRASLSWAPDSRRLAFVTQPDTAAPDGYHATARVAVLDTDANSSLGDAQVVGPPLTELGHSSGWSNVVWQNSTTLWAVDQDRCGQPAPRLLRISVSTGAAKTAAVFKTWRQAPAPLGTGLGVDAAGRLLWVNDGDVQSYRNGRTVTIARSADVPAEREYIAAGWVPAEASSAATPNPPGASVASLQRRPFGADYSLFPGGQRRVEFGIGSPWRLSWTNGGSSAVEIRITDKRTGQVVDHLIVAPGSGSVVERRACTCEMTVGGTEPFKWTILDLS